MTATTFSLRKAMTDARRKGGFSLCNNAAIRALRPVHSTINARADMRACFDAVAVDGKAGRIVSGMDCDCTQYRYESLIDVPVSIVAYLKAEDDDAEWLDGPQSTYIVAPSEVDDGYRASADRALEAFENGHPHSVTWGAL